jgi:GntR family transcriptional repressor for pyruvate dehydrogenase complex
VIRRSHAISGGVAAYLEQLIETDLSPGDKLPTERGLAESLGVSRTSVREALRELEQRRLITRAPGRGTVVSAPSDAAVALTGLAGTDPEQADVAELRMLVEPQIAGLAAQRATAADLIRLEDILAASHAGLTPTESLTQDMAFHQQLAHASGNPLLASLCSVTNEWVTEVRSKSHASRAGRRSSVEGHRELYLAVAAGDPARATQAMVAHLAEVARLVGQAR